MRLVASREAPVTTTPLQFQRVSAAPDGSSMCSKPVNDSDPPARVDLRGPSSNLDQEGSFPPMEEDAVGTGLFPVRDSPLKGFFGACDAPGATLLRSNGDSKQSPTPPPQHQQAAPQQQQFPELPQVSPDLPVDSATSIEESPKAVDPGAQGAGSSAGGLSCGSDPETDSLECDEESAPPLTAGPVCFRCPVCAHASTSRQLFAQHLSTHTRCTFKCLRCEYEAPGAEAFRTHMRQAHGAAAAEAAAAVDAADEEDEDIRTPKVNSQGKVKVYRCKQCRYLAITKLDFWEHSRVHIRAEKLLTCSRCPFVTEYKHHLEYHLRNHFGSKPFRCARCAYSCVNKSMLNSHMKSHSSVYQYRCANCSYATKYCHSLKLHLRKYGHAPAAVLNADGSPSPFPVIDVYGTRRGPKLKAATPTAEQQQQQHDCRGTHLIPGGGSGKQPPTQNQPPSLLNHLHHHHHHHHLQLHEEDEEEEDEDVVDGVVVLGKAGPRPQVTVPLPKGHLKCSMCHFSTGDRDVFSRHVLLHAASENKDIAALFGISPEHLEPGLPSLPRISKDAAPYPLHHQPPPRNHHHYLQRHLLPQPANGHQFFFRECFPAGSSPFLFRPVIARDSRTNPDRPLGEGTDKRVVPAPANGLVAPLDLSSEARSENHRRFHHLPFPQQQQNGGNITATTTNNGSSGVGADFPAGQRDSSAAIGDRGAKSHRRKGKAFKLERLPRSDEDCQSPSSHEDGEEDRPPPLAETVIPGGKVSPDTRQPQQHQQQPHACTYCDMTFRDVVMYTMHMGYHGYQNPFTCNMCGQQTQDKVSFFLHIARSSHS